MASINIKSLGAKKKFDYVFKDFRFDIEENSNASSGNLFKNKTTNDILASTDMDAINNSIKNLFTTVPGQKLLDPEYGLDLRQFLFLPVSESTAELIAEKILQGISRFDPRVIVDKISVIADEEQSQYEIGLTLTVPDIDALGKKLNLNLNQSGVSFS